MFQESWEVWRHLYEPGCFFYLFIPRSLTVHLFLTNRMCFSFINASLSFENKMVLFFSCSWRSDFSLNFMTWLNLFLFSELSAVSNFHLSSFHLFFDLRIHLLNTFCVPSSLRFQHLLKMSKMQPWRSLLRKGRHSYIITLGRCVWSERDNTWHHRRKAQFSSEAAESWRMFLFL